MVEGTQRRLAAILAADWSAGRGDPDCDVELDGGGRTAGQLHPGAARVVGGSDGFAEVRVAAAGNDRRVVCRDMRVAARLMSLRATLGRCASRDAARRVQAGEKRSVVEYRISNIEQGMLSSLDIGYWMFDVIHPRLQLLEPVGHGLSD